MKRLRRIYQRTLKREFGTSGILFPPTHRLALGDYGYFVHGTFVPEGNVFKDHGLPLENFIQNDLQNSPEFSAMVTSESATQFGGEAQVNANGKFTVELGYKFEANKGFVLQLQKVKTDSIYLKSKIDELVADLRNSGRWKPRYRMVWQRFVTSNMKFAYTLQRNSQIAFKGNLDNEFINNFGTIELGIDYSKTMNVKTDMWVDSGEITVAVNMARFNSLNQDLVHTKSMNTAMAAFQKSAFEAGRLQPDNSDSFEDLLLEVQEEV